MAVRIFHWRAREDLGNFGDALTLLYTKRMLADQCFFHGSTLHLVGSVIGVDRIKLCMKDGFMRGDQLGRAVYWGCGKKNADPLPPELQRRAVFLGIRGVGSRDALGLPRSTPMGDTALLLPRFYTPSTCPETAGKVLWVPHVHHPDPTEQDFEGCPDPILRSPAIPNTPEACEALIDAICSARFVMANAMHAAVVALAYGIPFAFWGGQFINVPFKWSDLTSGLGFDLGFAANFAEGQRLYDAVRPDRAYMAWDPEPLLDVAPLRVRAT